MDSLTISPLYVARLRRVQEAMLKTTGRHVSAAGLLEEVLSDFLYTAEIEFDLMPLVLPVVEIEGTRYYRDDRLKEFRNVNNPHDRIVMR
jgi:hypothetical protein